jgi:hypothetical protein
MMLDVQNLLSDAQNLAQAAGAYYGTNAIDLGTPGVPPLFTSGLGMGSGSLLHDIGRGDADFFSQITEDFASGGAATLQVQLLLADTADGLTNPVIFADTGALALATLKAGYRFRFGQCPIPPGIQTAAKKFLCIKYTIGAFAMTAGKVTAGLVDEQPTGIGSIV